jgi:hypothetical protein
LKQNENELLKVGYPIIFLSYFYYHQRPAEDLVDVHSDRQSEVEAGVSYSHSWGLLEAINKTFESFSKMPTS